MSVYYCDQCKEAFLPEATATDGNQLFCKKCHVPLSNLGSEDGAVSLKAHIESKYGDNKVNYHKFDLVESKHYTLPSQDSTLMECNALLSVNPLNTDALFTLSQWYFSKGSVDESLAIANQIISIDPSYEKAHQFISEKTKLQSKKNFSLPENLTTLENMAVSYFNQQKFDQAIPTLQKILKIEPKHPAAHRYLAEIYTSINEHQLAIHHFNVLTLIFPNDYRVFYNFAVLFFQMNDYSRSLSNLNYAYKICHDDPEFLQAIQDMIDHIQSIT